MVNCIIHEARQSVGLVNMQNFSINSSRMREEKHVIVGALNRK